MSSQRPEGNHPGTDKNRKLYDKYPGLSSGASPADISLLKLFFSV